MAILDDLTKGPVPLLVGLGLVAAPNVIPTVASGLRPLAKILVRTGMSLFDVVKESVAEVGEQLIDLVEESRAEMAERTHQSMNASGEESTERSNHGRGRRRYRG